MNPVARLELACARLVEGTFARIFPSSLDPAQIGRKLVAAMQARPGDLFLVRVHPVDYARLAADRDFLEARWSALLREAHPVPGSVERPRALLHEDTGVVAGSVTVDAVGEERVTPVPPDVSSVALVIERIDGSRVAVHDGLRIGRAGDNDLIVRDPRVSRYHARIVADGVGYTIDDSGSSNGTFVNGRAIKRSPLTPGATVTLGDTHLRIVCDGP